MPVTQGIHVPFICAGEFGRWFESRSPCSSEMRYHIRVNANHDTKKLETNAPIVYLEVYKNWHDYFWTSYNFIPFNWFATHKSFFLPPWHVNCSSENILHKCLLFTRNINKWYIAMAFFWNQSSSINKLLDL